MAEVIVITSGKGGVGKTTTTANIGIGLAQLDKRVLLIDADIGLRNLDVALGLENNVVYDLVDVVSGLCSASQATISDSKYKNLSMIPAAQTTDKDAVTVEQMKKLCAELADEYDYILIDCPAGIEQGFKNAIAAADKAIIVTTPDVSAVRDADRVIGLLEDNGILDYSLVLNKIRPEIVRAGNMFNVDDVLDSLKITLLGIIPDDTSIIIGAYKNEPVVLNKKSPAGQAYRNISMRITGKTVDLINLDKKRLFKKTKRSF